MLGKATRRLGNKTQLKILLGSAVTIPTFLVIFIRVPRPD
jgi:hypothetical protein